MINKRLLISLVPLAASSIDADRIAKLEELRIANAIYRLQEDDSPSERISGPIGDALRECSKHDFEPLRRFYETGDRSEVERMIASGSLCPMAQVFFEDYRQDISHRLSDVDISPHSAVDYPVEAVEPSDAIHADEPLVD